MIPAPTLADLQTSAGWLRETYPVSDVVYRNGGGFTLTMPLTDPAVSPGGCSANWNNLLTQVRNAANADGNRPGWAYFGLMPSGVPMGAVVGCGGSGVGVGGVGPDNVTLAHEVGHAFGVRHAPCGQVGTPNSAYPVYEPYDPPIMGPNFASASTGEFGVRVSTQEVYDPQTTKDFMSYCGPDWISLWMTRALLSATVLLRNDVTPALGMARENTDRTPLIVIVGVVHLRKGHEHPTVDVLSVARLETRQPKLGAPLAGFMAELLGDDGAVLAEGTLDRLESQGQDGGDDALPAEGGVAFQATFADLAPGAQLRIRRDEEVLWTSSPRTISPTIELGSLEVKEESLEATWTSSAAVPPEHQELLSVRVQWRAVGQEEWSSLAVGLKGDRAELDMRELPRREPVAFRFLLHDGFTTALAESTPLQLPARPPAAASVQPQSPTIPEGQQLYLLGDGVSYSSETLPVDAFRWGGGRPAGGRNPRGMGTGTQAGSARAGSHRVRRVRQYAGITPDRGRAAGAAGVGDRQSPPARRPASTARRRLFVEDRRSGTSRTYKREEAIREQHVLATEHALEAHAGRSREI